MQDAVYEVSARVNHIKTIETTLELERSSADQTMALGGNESYSGRLGSPAGLPPDFARVAVSRECAAVMRRRSLTVAGRLCDPGSVTASLPRAEGHRTRIRRKLIEAGPGALPDHELIELLLSFAHPRRDTKPIARALMDRFGSFADALSAPTSELYRVAGLSDIGISVMRTVQAAALRLTQAPLKTKQLLNNWERLTEYLTAAMARDPVEQFRVIFLDGKNRLISDEVQARGTVDQAPIYPREVMKRALELHATALILVHNHPSGDPTPSRLDIEMTAEVDQAAAALGITLHDHLIIGRNTPLSFRREGLL